MQAILRVFSALADHDIRRSIKEIAIRKLFGASGEQLMCTFSKPFFLIDLIANVIAWPVGFLIADKWLANFAYRVHIPISFLPAFFISVVLVVFTVCLQIARAVRFSLAGN